MGTIHEKRVTVFESDIVPGRTFETYEEAEQVEVNHAVAAAMSSHESVYLNAISPATAIRSEAARADADKLRAVLRFLADKATAAATTEWLAEREAKATEQQAAE